MPKITFISHLGDETVLEIPVGTTLRDGAVNNGLPGIIGMCGGKMRCATCHMFVDEPWLQRLREPNAEETIMLGFAAVARRPNSRLGCQIVVSEEMDGLSVRLPEMQRRPRKVATT
jgi:2Fe-2S ferredoxin